MYGFVRESGGATEPSRGLRLRRILSNSASSPSTLLLLTIYQPPGYMSRMRKE
jgi:hypothetical protein